MLDNRVRENVDLRGKKLHEDKENITLQGFIICAVHRNLGGWGTTMIQKRVTRWAGHTARTGEKRISYRVLVGESEGLGIQKKRKITCKNQG